MGYHSLLVVCGPRIRHAASANSNGCHTVRIESRDTPQICCGTEMVKERCGGWGTEGKWIISCCAMLVSHRRPTWKATLYCIPAVSTAIMTHRDVLPSGLSHTRASDARSTRLCVSGKWAAGTQADLQVASSHSLPSPSCTSQHDCHDVSLQSGTCADACHACCMLLSTLGC